MNCRLVRNSIRRSPPHHSSPIAAARKSATETIRTPWTSLSGSRCLLPPVTRKSARPPTAHSTTISSPGSDVIPGSRRVGNTSSPTSDSSSPQGSGSRPGVAEVKCLHGLRVLCEPCGTDDAQHLFPGDTFECTTGTALPERGAGHHVDIENRPHHGDCRRRRRISRTRPTTSCSSWAVCSG